jgi:hypothetical protein
MMNSVKKIEWKWGALAAVAITVVAIYPELNLWLTRGQWNGSYFTMHYDEVAYSAYINALIDGRPRRSDPYTGRDDRIEAPQPESPFSIQFIPAYALALPARLLGLTAAQTFIALTAIAACGSALALFWLIAAITGNNRLAASSVLFVLCFGTLIARQGDMNFLQALGSEDKHFAFLRRYQPAATFPLFFLFCLCVWRAITCEAQRRAIGLAAGAGLIFGVLVFSYFYLWTCAAAWMASLAFIWLIARPGDWRRLLFCTAIICVFALIALGLYAVLISHRAETVDEVQALTRSRAPNLQRMSELVGAGALAGLFVGRWRSLLDWKAPSALVATSFALAPFVIHNQQVITGFSLQPIHYENYIANYVVLLAVTITATLVWRGLEAKSSRIVKIKSRVLIFIALLSVGYAVLEATSVVARRTAYARLRDEAIPLFTRLRELAGTDGTFDTARQGPNPRPIVLSANLGLADDLPTYAPQAVLWAVHMPVFQSVTMEESRKRFYHHLYFAGFSEKDFATALAEKNFTFIGALFGFERALPALSVGAQPVTDDELRAEIRRYSELVKNFSRQQATDPPLSYVFTLTAAEPDMSNLDRWYERDAGERIGIFTLYRVKLRPSNR